MSVGPSSSGRIPQGEVVMEFGDGGQYIKHKLENAVVELERRRLTREEGQKAQKAMQALELSKDGAPKETPLKTEDVDFIIAQLGCSKPQAEDALRSEGGDLVKALVKLVRPKPRAKSLESGTAPNI